MRRHVQCCTLKPDRKKRGSPCANSGPTLDEVAAPRLTGRAWVDSVTPRVSLSHTLLPLRLISGRLDHTRPTVPMAVDVTGRPPAGPGLLAIAGDARDTGGFGL